MGCGEAPCLWGLASGIGFGVSEDRLLGTANGMSGIDIYLVRFVSCVALHAMWSGSVGIAIARNVDEYEQVEDYAGFGLFMLKDAGRPRRIPCTACTTLLRKTWGSGRFYVVALLSFVVLSWPHRTCQRFASGRGGPGV